MAVSNFLSEKPTLCELSENINIGTKWYEFGVLLKLDTDKLDDIKVMDGDVNMKTFKMFEFWLSASPNGSRGEIIETLRKQTIDENIIADEYKKTLTKGECCNLYITILLTLQWSKKRSQKKH